MKIKMMDKNTGKETVLNHQSVLKFENNHTLLTLDLSQQDISTAVRKGNDLHLVLNNGETLIIQDYFLYTQNSIVLTEGTAEQLLLPVSDHTRGFVVSDYASSAGAEKGMLSSKWMWIGGGAVAVAGAAMAAGGGGDGGGGGDSTSPPVNQKAVLSSADVKVTEMDIPLIVTGRLSIKDIDSPETFLAQNDIAGKYGHFSIDTAGAWTYTSNSAHNQLAVNESIADIFTVFSSDGTTTTVKVTIKGTNDLPVVTGSDTATVTEDLVLTATGQLKVTDIDASDIHSWHMSNGGTGQYGTFSVSNTGKWTYTLNNNHQDIQALAKDESLTDNLSVIVDDGYGGQVTRELSVLIQGNNDQPVIGGDTVGRVKEDELFHVEGQLSVKDADKSDQHKWMFSNGYDVWIDFNGDFKIDEHGKWVYDLKNYYRDVQALGLGETDTYSATVMVEDGQGGQAFIEITVTIEGTNDLPDFLTMEAIHLYEDIGITSSGFLSVQDLDVNDKVILSGGVANDGLYGNFVLDTDGRWSYILNNKNPNIQALNIGEKIWETVTVDADDGHGVLVENQFYITIHGINDNPVISGDDTAFVSDNLNATVSGQLSVSDIDRNDSYLWRMSEMQGIYGTLRIGADNTWTYVLDHPDMQVTQLKEGESLADTFYMIVEDSHGGTGEFTLNILIQGKNDEPILLITDTNHYTDSVTPLQIDFMIEDPEYDFVTIGISEQPAHGHVELRDMYGYFIYTPSGNYSGMDSFSYTLNDGHGGVVTQTITVQVRAAAESSDFGFSDSAYENDLLNILSVEHTADTITPENTYLMTDIGMLLSDHDGVISEGDRQMVSSDRVQTLLVADGSSKAKAENVHLWSDIGTHQMLKINDLIQASYL